MSCCLCASPLKKGQFFVALRGYVTITDGLGQRVAEPVVFEDGSSAQYAHWGCLLKRGAPPELLGIRIGELKCD